MSNTKYNSFGSAIMAINSAIFKNLSVLAKVQNNGSPYNMYSTPRNCSIIGAM
jgi:hypothetical protein